MATGSAWPCPRCPRATVAPGRCPPGEDRAVVTGGFSSSLPVGFLAEPHADLGLLQEFFGGFLGALLLEPQRWVQMGTGLSLLALTPRCVTPPSHGGGRARRGSLPLFVPKLEAGWV